MLQYVDLGFFEREQEKQLRLFLGEHSRRRIRASRLTSQTDLKRELIERYQSQLSGARDSLSLENYGNEEIGKLYQSMVVEARGRLSQRREKDKYPGNLKRDMADEVSEESKARIVKYLFIHRDNPVSLADIQRATKLDSPSVLEILAGLSEEGVLNYQLNPQSETGRRYLDEYEERTSQGFLDAYRESSDS